MRGWRYKDDPDYDLFGKKKAVGKPKDSSTSKSEEMLLEEEKERNSYRLKILGKLSTLSLNDYGCLLLLLLLLLLLFSFL